MGRGRDLQPRARHYKDANGGEIVEELLLPPDASLNAGGVSSSNPRIMSEMGGSLHATRGEGGIRGQSFDDDNTHVDLNKNQHFRREISLQQRWRARCIGHGSADALSRRLYHGNALFDRTPTIFRLQTEAYSLCTWLAQSVSRAPRGPWTPSSRVAPETTRRRRDEPIPRVDRPRGSPRLKCHTMCTPADVRTPCVRPVCSTPVSWEGSYRVRSRRSAALSSSLSSVLAHSVEEGETIIWEKGFRPAIPTWAAWRRTNPAFGQGQTARICKAWKRGTYWGCRTAPCRVY